eukprot:358440-Chlamydomonas_euryale.AAC.1
MTTLAIHGALWHDCGLAAAGCKSLRPKKGRVTGTAGGTAVAGEHRVVRPCVCEGRRSFGRRPRQMRGEQLECGAGSVAGRRGVGRATGRVGAE